MSRIVIRYRNPRNIGYGNPTYSFSGSLKGEWAT